MRAKYHKIVARIADDIHSGRLQPSARLPTHRQLAWEHGLSLGTATRVFAELDAMGLTTRRGRARHLRAAAKRCAGGQLKTGTPDQLYPQKLRQKIQPRPIDPPRLAGMAARASAIRRNTGPDAKA